MLCLVWYLRARLFNTIVLAAMTYGAELWTVANVDESPIAVEHRRMARGMLGITIMDFWSNRRIYRISMLKPIAEVAVRRKWKFARTIAQMPEDRWPRRIAEWYPRTRKRAQARPPMRWSDEFKEMGVNWLRTFRDDKDTVKL